MMAMQQVPITNRLPHMDELGLFEDRHYLGFDTVAEGVAKVEWALTHPDQASAIALNAYSHVHQNHTYELRVEQILKTTGLL
jgi:spore maturation protein CgeB